jgi:hypothetical protein
MSVPESIKEHLRKESELKRTYIEARDKISKWLLQIPEAERCAYLRKLEEVSLHIPPKDEFEEAELKALKDVIKLLCGGR